jgi:tripartite-type tricarboxylate transporter receptor subunit TctC
LLACGAAQAQGGYPSKPIQIINAGGPGTTMDTTVRLFASTITQQTGNQIIVDYKGGAGGTIGAAYVSKQPPDGHTLMGTISSYTISPSLYTNLPYDPLKDLAPVTQMTGYSFVWVINPSLPFKNMSEYLAFVRANPGKLNYGTSGQGSSLHMGGALLHYMTKTDVTYVHYKTGTQRAQDFLAGRLDVMLESPRNYMNALKQGKTRGLGVTSSERFDWLPDMPTVAEQGVPGYEFSSWNGIFAPGRTPPAIVNQVHKWFFDAGKEPNLAKKLAGAEQDVVTSAPAVFAKRINTEIPRWREVIKAANIKLEGD